MILRTTVDPDGALELKIHQEGLDTEWKSFDMVSNPYAGPLPEGLLSVYKRGEEGCGWVSQAG